MLLSSIPERLGLKLDPLPFKHNPVPNALTPQKLLTVCDQVFLPCNMFYISGKLRDEGELVLLASCPWFSPLTHSKCQWLVIHKAVNCPASSRNRKC